MPNKLKLEKNQIAEFEKGGRDDLKDAAQSEIAILEKYMPEQMSEEEVLVIIEEVMSEVKPSSMKDMGKNYGSNYS